MNKLNAKNWKEFKLENIFEITGSETTSKEKLKNYGIGKYNYVTTKASNNGVDGKYNYYTEKGNVLTVDSAVLGFCSYQDENFSASDHVEKLIPRFNLNEHIALFLVPIINQEQYRYSYGRKCSQERIKEMSIKLPSKNGKPDWKFMEDYIKDIYKKVEIKVEKESLIDEDIRLDIKNWVYFKMKDIFEDISIAKSVDLLNLDQADSGVNFISRSGENNGLIAKITRNNKFIDFINKGNCLSVVMVGDLSCFYQKNDFFASQNILLLRNENLNIFNSLFIANIICLEEYRFSYGRTLSKTFFSTHRIKLPAKNGRPDWKFMEDYIKTLPYSKSL